MASSRCSVLVAAENERCITIIAATTARATAVCTPFAIIISISYVSILPAPIVRLPTDSVDVLVWQSFVVQYAWCKLSGCTVAAGMGGTSNSRGKTVLC